MNINLYIRINSGFYHAVRNGMFYAQILNGSISLMTETGTIAIQKRDIVITDDTTSVDLR